MMAALAPTPHPAATNTSVIGRAADMEVDETAWILPFIFQWVLLFAPAVVLRKYRCRPMSKGNAIGASAGISIFWVILAVLLADYLGIESGYPGGVNTGPIAIGALFSFWILRKESVFGDSASLKMRDRVFKKFFPETNTSCPAQTERGQHPQAAESKHEISGVEVPDQFYASLKNKSKAGNYIRDYVVSPLRPDEINMTATPTIDEDVLYEQAFNELQRDERVVATWSRAFSEAEGDENKAKALYISARVNAQKRELLAKFEAAQFDAEAEAEAEAEAVRLEVARKAEAACDEQAAKGSVVPIQEKKEAKWTFIFAIVISAVAVGLLVVISLVG
jgi:hypothetical protein